VTVVATGYNHIQTTWQKAVNLLVVIFILRPLDRRLSTC